MSNGIDGVSYTSATSIQGLFATIPPATTDQLSTTNPLTDPNGPFANLNLTAQQQTQIQQLFDSGSADQKQTPTQLFNSVESLLSPQQQQTLRNDLETSGTHHHHHHGAQSASTSSTSTTQLEASTDTPQVDTSA